MQITNEEIEKFVFHDKELDQIKDFDYCLRSSLIKTNISKKEYLILESIRQIILSNKKRLSKEAQSELKEMMINI